MNDFKHLWMNLKRRISNALYVPSQTGSHDIGRHYLGDLASAYVEHKNLPESARAPIQRIQVTPKS